MDMARRWKPKGFINLIPLIDVFVNLVFFFVVFSSMSGGSAAVPVRLPGSKTASSVRPDRIVVALDKDGRYLIEGSVVTATEVSGFVSVALSQNPGLQVVILPDQAVPYQTLVAALDLVREGGAERPALGVRRQEISPDADGNSPLTRN